MVNDTFLLNKLFEFTDVTSENINDMIGKTIRACLDGRGAIGHSTKDCFVIPNYSKVFKLEELKSNL